jgi:uncharacterized protein DUF6544
VDGQGLLEARLFGSLRVAHAAGPQIGKGELMRYLANSHGRRTLCCTTLSYFWRGIDATAVEVSAESPAGPARVRLIFENGGITRVEADDRPRAVGLPHCSDTLARTLLRLPRVGWLPHPDLGGGKLAVEGCPLRVLARQGNGISG